MLLDWGSTFNRRHRATRLQPAQFLAMVTERRPAGQTGVFKLLQTTLYFDLHRSNAFCLLHNTISEDPEQIAVFESPVLQQ